MEYRVKISLAENDYKSTAKTLVTVAFNSIFFFLMGRGGGYREY